ncbi:MAG: DUF1624 domain-containing protein [Vicinamibacterales bacterium]
MANRGAIGAEPVTRTRVQAVDILRGLVMVVMALDHTRDYVHAAAMAFQPEDLRQATPAIFMTRWITHFCAPVFMFCAGTAAFLRLERGGSRSELSRFLWTRGFWLIVLEFTVVRAGFFFDIGIDPLLLVVFWALGMSMIALALLVHLPYAVLLGLSVAMIALHNVFDAIPAARFGAYAWLWQILHAQGLLRAAGPTVIVGYPLVPWIGVMAAGYCFGRVYRLPAERRRNLLMKIGVALTAAFVVIRMLDVYGDPRPWNVQSQSIYTVLSFLNTTKYPASLAFLLMTLGPALMFLAWADRIRVGERHPLLVFGRVPLSYFVLHIPLIHATAIALTWIRYGAAPFLFTPPPTLGTPRSVFPPDYGWDLWVVYAVWVAIVLALYPVCLWFMRLKARRRDRWLSYF